MKEINIEGNLYNIACNAWTMIEYRRIFNKSILDDINLTRKVLATQVIATQMYKQDNPSATEVELETIAASATEAELEKFIEALLMLTWIFIYTANQDVKEYQEWLKDVKKINISSNWVSEVTELAVASFR